MKWKNDNLHLLDDPCEMIFDNKAEFTLFLSQIKLM